MKRSSILIRDEIEKLMQKWDIGISEAFEVGVIALAYLKGETKFLNQRNEKIKNALIEALSQINQMQDDIQKLKENLNILLLKLEPILSHIQTLTKLKQALKNEGKAD